MAQKSIRKERSVVAILLRFLIFFAVTIGPFACFIIWASLEQQGCRTEYDPLYPDAPSCILDGKDRSVLYQTTAAIGILSIIAFPITGIWMVIWGFFAVRELIRLLVRLFRRTPDKE